MYYSPVRAIVLSVLVLIVLGTIFLSLPICQNKPLELIDCFFTATSMTCLTGTLTVSLDSFSIWGKAIIMSLIQISGIGFVTLAMSFFSLFFNLDMSTQLMMRKVLDLDDRKSVKKLIFFITAFSFLVEIIGAIFIYINIKNNPSISNPVFHSLFHSISSFCSAGVSIFGNSMLQFKHNIPMLIITGILVFLGGIGFIVCFEVFNFVKNKIIKKRYNFSLTTKVVISATAVLMTIFSLLFFIIEYKQLSNLNFFEKIFNVLFNCIAYRSAGLTTISVESMHVATVFLIIMYGCIGSSPVSAGGGIRVSTAAVVFAAIRAVLTRKHYVELHGRTISQEQAFKAMVIVVLSSCWVIFSTFLLLLVEDGKSFIKLFFETVSSCTTLGLATEITPELSVLGKLLISYNMFIGRLGILTLLLALTVKAKVQDYHYPEERIILS